MAIAQKSAPALNPVFKGATAAAGIERGTPLDDGDYTVKIIKTILKNTQKVGQQFIVEFEVLKSTHAAHPVGTKRTWMQAMKSPQIAFNALRGFTVALAGLSEADNKQQIEDEFMPHQQELLSQAVDESTEGNALAGSTADVKVTTVQTAPSAGHPNGHPFRRHDWRPAT